MFSNVDEFREAVRNHVIPQGKAVKFKPSERTRVRANCKNP